MTQKRRKKPAGRIDWRREDPHYAREKAKYGHPVPSREFLLQCIKDLGVPTAWQELADRLGMQEEDDREAIRRRLKAMERDGSLLRNRRGGYVPVGKQDLIRGRVTAHPDGFGFLIPDEGGSDLFLSAREMRRVFHGDRLVARVVGEDRRGRREGAVVEVLERNTHQVVGRFFREAGATFVVPDNKRIVHNVVIPGEESGGAEPGQIVTADILEQPSQRNPPVGRIVEVLGDHMAPGMEIDIAARSYDLPSEWPEAVEEEIAGLGEKVTPAAKRGREDLRKLPLVTIDGADSRDFDDAVYCEAKPKGWRLLVAIADVAHYVQPGTALDQEAFNRGNSVYFPERVIPMLPEVLSNGLCSINPDVDRLCMVADMYINREGKLLRSRFFEGLMRSHARLTYDQVAAILLEGDKTTRKEFGHVVSNLEELHRLYDVLRKARVERGAIDFDTTETRIVFGSERKIERIVPVERNDAHKLIEECMVTANVAAARFLARHKMPTLFRVHAGPKSEKIEDLHTFLGEVGLSLKGGDKPTAQDYSRLLESVQNRPDAHLIQTVLLRSMSQAVYTPDNSGHFGLALDQYAHFTSPIRRYPDLLVHRAIRHVLRNSKRKKPQAFNYSHSDMQKFGEQCSMTERRADEATRDAEDWLKCEYMMDKVGEVYEGVISSVTSFGIFVELRDIFVEGLVHITALKNDYYHFEAHGHRLIGERTHRIYRLGDSVRVKVARVDLDERKMDLELAETESETGTRQPKDRSRDQAAGESAPESGDGKPKRRRGGRKRGGRGGAGGGSGHASQRKKKRSTS